MAPVGSNVKMAFFKGLEALGKGASNMASNAQQKLSEINLETRRRELLSEIPVRALDLWQKGAEMPPALGEMLKELSELDEQLTVLRAQRYAKVEEEESGEESSDGQTAEGEETEAAEEAAEDISSSAEDNAAVGCPDGEDAVREEADAALPQEPADEGETGDNA